MLVVTLDVSGLVARLEAMSKKLEEFPKHMAEELTAWQTEDMRRRFPNTEMPDENSVETDIWPTSRVVERDQKKINKIIRARKNAGGKALGVSGKPIAGHHRPILRPELYEKLVKRMDELMAKELSWR
jgi:hypothetical protein